MGGRRGDISTKSMGEAKALWASLQHNSTQYLPSTQQAAGDISRIRIRDKTGKTWYSGDASASQRQGPWFAKRMGLSVM